MTDTKGGPPALEPKKYRNKHSDPDYKGDPCDKELANGPMEKRGCTDILCCLIFIGYIVGMVIVSSFALKNGNPEKLIDPFDSDGNQCGSGKTEAYPYLYFPIPFPGKTNYTVCMKYCPSYQGSSDYPTQVNCYPNSFVPSCTGSISTESISKAILDSQNYNPLNGQFYIYNTTGYVGRYCIPSLTYFSTLKDVTAIIDSVDVIEQWISDIKVAWPIILASLGIAFGIGLFYMIFVRCCSGVLVWLAIFSLIACSGGFGYYLFKHAQYKEALYATNAMQSTSGSGSTTVKTLKYFAYFFWGFAVFTVLAVCCLYNKIKLAIGIIKAAADYVRNTWAAMLVPIIMLVLLSVLYIYWIYVGIYLYSYGTVTQIPGSPFGTVTWNVNTKRLLVFHLFGGLWGNAFIVAMAQLVLAISVSLWYFNIAYDKAHATIRQGWYRAIRYHIGSLAFGSFIVAFIQLVRIIWAYVQKQLKPYEEKTGGCLVKCAVWYVTCCLDCFERYIKFLNKNAYIQIALEGKSFLRAAINAFYLILRNGMMFVLVGGLGQVFIGFGKYLIALATAGIGYIILTQVDRYNSRLYSALMPAFIMFCLGFAVGALFMSVYGMAADTILQCYILTKDLMQNHNINIKPPTALQDFIDNNKEVKAQDLGEAVKK